MRRRRPGGRGSLRLARAPRPWCQVVRFNDFLRALPKAMEADEEEEEEEETMALHHPNSAVV